MGTSLGADLVGFGSSRSREGRGEACRAGEARDDLGRLVAWEGSARYAARDRMGLERLVARGLARPGKS